MNKFFVLFALLGFVSCDLVQRHPSLELSLELSGANRVELEQVLGHYAAAPADSLKLRAAEFLIENMRWHHTAQGDRLTALQRRIDSLFAMEGLSREQYVAYLKNIMETTTGSRKTSLRPDLENIDAAMLIDNIDAAFAACWGLRDGTLAFDDFCEYVLPYRVGVEPVGEWRAAYNNRFGRAIDSLRLNGATDSVTAQFLTHSYKENHFLLPYSVPLPAATLLDIRAGDCVLHSELGAFAGRAAGMPVAVDFTPQWGNGSGRHRWNALLLPDGRQISYSMGDFAPFDTHLLRAKVYTGRVLAKVYRKTFSANPEVLKILATGERIPSFLRDPCFADVTDRYVPTVDVTVTLTAAPPSQKRLVYAMVFDNREWRPVAWGWTKRGKKATFTDLGTGCAYIAMYYDEDGFHPACDPFTVDADGQVMFLKPDHSSLETVSPTRKYRDHTIALRLRNTPGDVIQLATRSDFSDAVDVFVIDSVPEARFHRIAVSDGRSYRYMRYIASDFTMENTHDSPGPTSKGNVAELEVYDSNGEKITGTVVGTPENVSAGGNDRSKAFDGNVLTFFEAPASTAAPWVGLRFDEPRQVGGVVYLPRNDNNSIREGEHYELFYWDSGGWVSLGQKHGDRSQVLEYHDVPRGALLWLCNLTKGKEERIFTWKNNRQMWW